MLEPSSVGRQPELALIQRGFTLEVMGDYEGAVAALLRAALGWIAKPIRSLGTTNASTWLSATVTSADAPKPRSWCREVRDLAASLGDRIFLPRITWLEGRIAAGLGRRAEALRLLEAARREFERRKMSYDVALALLEEAVLLLEEDRTAEVKALAEELTAVFEANGVHREALAALRLFVEAAEREEATAELARRVLRFLFRARHDPELRFKET